MQNLIDILDDRMMNRTRRKYGLTADTSSSYWMRSAAWCISVSEVSGNTLACVNRLGTASFDFPSVFGDVTSKEISAVCRI